MNTPYKNSPNRQQSGKSHQTSQQHSRADEESSQFDTKRIMLAVDGDKKLPVDLFSTIAQDAAKAVASSKKKHNKPSQLRKFYDEISMWDAKVQTSKQDFAKHLPFILMMKAKVAYAEGRDHIDKVYEAIINHCLSEVERTQDPATLHNGKLFLEAFTGFYKQERPSDSDNY